MDKAKIFPTVQNVPAVTREEVIMIDELMINRYEIKLIQMMENSGANLTDCIIKVFNPGSDSRILVFVGTGNNAGGALAAARHLRNRGLQPEIMVVRGKHHLKDATRHQLKIARELNIPVHEYDPEFNLESYGLIVDGLIGYNLKGELEKPFAEIIQLINRSAIPVISLDLPSGIDANEGKIYPTCIHAHVTMALALPKAGMLKKGAKQCCGKIFLADINVPYDLLSDIASIPDDMHYLFRESRILELSDT